jgi:F-box domain
LPALKPLLLDRVMAGRDIASKSALFLLPLDILGQIVQSLRTDDLAALALVNSDCRQLARSEQFKSVHLDFSCKASSLAASLSAQGTPRRPAALPGICLGPAVRRLLVATNQKCLADRYNLNSDLQVSFVYLVQKRRLILAEPHYFQQYLRDIEAAFLSGALPHLELLDWEDQYILYQPMFRALVSTSIQHLRLYGVIVDRDFEVQLPYSPSRSHWPLRYLHL